MRAFRALDLLEFFFSYSYLFFLRPEFITLAVLYCVHLAELGLRFPEFPPLCSFQ